MSSNALKSQGMTIGIGDGASPEVFTTIGEVNSIGGLGGQAAEIDSTDLGSAAKEIRMGLPDEGTASLGMFWLPKDTQHALLRSKRNSQVAVNFRITFTDSPPSTMTFLAFVLGIEIGNEVDGVTTGSVTLRVSGLIAEA